MRCVMSFVRVQKRPSSRDLTRLELEEAPDNIRAVLTSIPDTHREDVALDEEALALADAYIHDGVVGIRHLVDAQHSAIATVERVDVLVGWNFKQIVNLDRVHAFNAVNLKRGYPVLEIRSPREVVHEKED
jgi:hypothetical protein